jgi:hypothetical protein
MKTLSQVVSVVGGIGSAVQMGVFSSDFSFVPSVLIFSCSICECEGT